MIVKKLAYVDVLRGVAILAVILVHCGYAGSPLYLPATITNVVRQGAFGVQLFFVASAFTLFYHLIAVQSQMNTELYIFLYAGYLELRRCITLGCFIITFKIQVK